MDGKGTDTNSPKPQDQPEDGSSSPDWKKSGKDKSDLDDQPDQQKERYNE